jgi:hypothetical protein
MARLITASRSSAASTANTNAAGSDTRLAA